MRKRGVVRVVKGALASPASDLTDGLAPLADDNLLLLHVIHKEVLLHSKRPVAQKLAAHRLDLQHVGNLPIQTPVPAPSPQ